MPNLPRHIYLMQPCHAMPDFIFCCLKHLIAEEKYSDWAEGYIYSYHVLNYTIMNNLFFFTKYLIKDFEINVRSSDLISLIFFMRTTKILIRLQGAQVDLTVRWPPISDGIFSQVTAHKIMTFCSIRKRHLNNVLYLFIDFTIYNP